MLCEYSILPPEYSVLLPVRFDESPDHLDAALKSVLGQTVPAKEIIVIIDGDPSEALMRLTDAYSDRSEIRTVVIPKKQSLGAVLNVGLTYVDTPLIMRMDSDDISLPYRAEILLGMFASSDDRESPAAVGTQIEEFSEDGEGAVRCVPLAHAEIVKTAKHRNPMNHVTVMLRADALRAVGGYPEIPGFEDYCLWGRLIAAGYRLENHCNITVRVRTDGFCRRRGGIQYFKHTIEAERYLHRLGIVSSAAKAVNLVSRFVLEVMAPPSLRGLIYRRFLRWKPR